LSWISLRFSNLNDILAHAFDINENSSAVLTIGLQFNQFDDKSFESGVFFE
jgi:hypothetical protein